MERVQLAEAAQDASVQVESETLRNVLLSAISHDFRTPLATIIGSASTLRDSDAALDEPRRRALLDTLLHEAERMNRLVGNLLDLTRLSEGRIELRHDWIAIDELIGAVLARLQGPACAASGFAAPAGRSAAGARRRGDARAGAVEPARERGAAHAGRHGGRDFGDASSASALEVAVRDHGAGLSARRGSARVREIPSGAAGKRAKRIRARPCDLQGDRRSARRHDHRAQRARRRRRIPLHAAAARDANPKSQ